MTEAAESPHRAKRSIRLAIVAPYPVLPLSSGGKVRIVQLARSLARLGVETTIVAPFHVTQTRSLADGEPFQLREVFYPPLIIPFLLVDRPFPYGALISFRPGYARTLPVSLRDFDIVQIEHPAFVDVARRAPESTPIVYGSQNVEYDYVSAESRPGVVRRMAGGRVRTLEAELIERSSHVFACTAADRSRFEALYGITPDRVTIVPNGVDLASVDSRLAGATPPSRLPSPRLKRRAIFAGSDVQHNRDAVTLLLDRVAPHFENEVEFVFIGSCARRFRGATGSNVVLDEGRDLAHYARPGDVGLNPVGTGSGSNLKLLYYLAHGLHVLTTPFGLRGFEDLLPWVTVRDVSDFPAALSSELPMREGVRTELERYEWDAVAGDALAVYEKLVAPSAGGTH